MIPAVRRHPVRAVLGIAGFLVVVLLAGAAYDALRIRSDLEAGRDALSDLTLTRINAAGGIKPLVDAAYARIEAADDRAHSSPFLKVLGAVPLASRQVDAARHLTSETHQVGKLGRDAADAIESDLDAAGSEPAARIELLDTVLDQLDRIDAGLDRIDLGKASGLIGPLRGARRTLESTIEDASKDLVDGRASVAALRGLLLGPTDYLVLAANNAEMRCGNGMPLSVGVAHISEGDVELGDFISVWEANPVGRPTGVAGNPPADLRETYPTFDFGGFIPETAASPNFPAIAPLHSSTADQTGLGPTSGVIQVDAVALRFLLAAIGPVEFEGKTYDATNIEQQILNEAYVEYGTSGEVRDKRLDLQGKLAATIFEELRTRDVPITELALALSSASKGRHLLAWSRDSEVQKVFRDFGATGDLAPSAMMVCAQNVSANKLDWYLDPKVHLTVRDTTSDDYAVRMTVAITNSKRTGTSPYIEGMFGDAPLGDHRLLLTVLLPYYAHDFGVVDRPFESVGTDGPMRVVLMRYVIPNGTTGTASLDFRVPKTSPPILVLPSARVRPVTISGSNFTVNDGEPVFVVLTPPVIEESNANERALAVAGALLGLAVALALMLGHATLSPEGSRFGSIALHRAAINRTASVLFHAATASALLGLLLTIIERRR